MAQWPPEPTIWTSNIRIAARRGPPAQRPYPRACPAIGPRWTAIMTASPASPIAVTDRDRPWRAAPDGAPAWRADEAGRRWRLCKARRTSIKAPAHKPLLFRGGVGVVRRHPRSGLAPCAAGASSPPPWRGGGRWALRRRLTSVRPARRGRIAASDARRTLDGESAKEDLSNRNISGTRRFALPGWGME